MGRMGRIVINDSSLLSLSLSSQVIRIVEQFGAARDNEHCAVRDNEHSAARDSTDVSIKSESATTKSESAITKSESAITKSESGETGDGILVFLPGIQAIEGVHQVSPWCIMSEGSSD